MKAKKNQLKKKAKKLLGEASKLLGEASKLTKKAKKLKERAKRLREKASNRTSKEDRGFVKYKGEWIKKGNKKDIERVDKRAKKSGEKAEDKKKLDLISQSYYSKKYDELTKKQKSFVKKKYKKYAELPRRKIEKILQEKHILDFIRKNQPVDGLKIKEDLLRNYRTDRTSLLKLEREHKINYQDSPKGYVIGDEFKKKMLI
jgi:hypothetical protein